MAKTKSIAGGILGIIGAVMSFFGTLQLSICAIVEDAKDAEIKGSAFDLYTSGFYSTIVWVLGITAFVCALVGAILCFKNSMVGGILLAVATAAIVIPYVVIGTKMGYWQSWTSIMAIVLLGVGTILAFTVKTPVGGQTPPPSVDNNNTPNA
ncbi:MAG: hypothetical protein K2M89_03990 [Clostridiales bacterium]|nr:hypothetical protein [Clostridiales bacterium]